MEKKETIFVELEALSYKLDEVKNKMFFVNEVIENLEKYAVKFDECEDGAASELAYSFSRVVIPLMSLLHGITTDIRQTEEGINEKISQLKRASKKN